MNWRCAWRASPAAAPAISSSAVWHSYHGNSASLAEVTTALPSPEPFAAHARAVPIPCLYRAPAGTTEAQLAEQYAANIAAAIASMQAQGIRPAALLIDTLFANEGLPRVPASFVNKAAALIRAAGGLFIADEVQSGFGRTGDHLWGHQAHGVCDIVTLGKPMGNGYPLAGLITHKALGRVVRSQRHVLQHLRWLAGGGGGRQCGPR